MNRNTTSSAMCAVASALLVVFGPVLAAEQDDGTDQNLAVVLAGAGVDPSNSALLIRRLEDDQEWASGGDRIEPIRKCVCYNGKMQIFAPMSKHDQKRKETQILESTVWRKYSAHSYRQGDSQCQ